MQFGQHTYIDLSDLNAKWDQALPAVAGLGSSNGSLSGNSLGMIGLGDAGGFTTAQVMEMQDLLNGNLAPAGYQQIPVDGTLGPATCGAIKWYQDNVNAQGGVSFAAACESVAAVSPKKLSAVSTRTASTVTRTPPSRASMVGMGGGPNWLLWGGAVAAVAVGGALIFKASKKR